MVEEAHPQSDDATPSWRPPKRSPDETLRILKALASPARMKIMRILSLGEAMRVSDIARAVGAPANSVSYHLRQLERAGIAHRTIPEQGQDARETWWQVPDWRGLALDPEVMNGIPGGAEALQSLSSVLQEDAAQLFSVFASHIPGRPGLQSDVTLRLTYDEARELVDQMGELVDRALTTSRSNATRHRTDADTYELRLVLRAPETLQPSDVGTGPGIQATDPPR